MPKSSKSLIYEEEKKFLNVLQRNAGENIENIAKKCGFSRQKVWRIKKRLEKNNTIWGYNTVFDVEKLAKKRYILLCKRSVNPIGDLVDNITNLIAEKKGEEMGLDFLSIGYVYGEYDISVILIADDIKYVKRFKEMLMTIFPGILSKIDILEYLFVLRDGGITNPEIQKIREFF
jgi:DNA-binding Lrp family transcriptional regulator